MGRVSFLVTLEGADEELESKEATDRCGSSARSLPETCNAQLDHLSRAQRRIFDLLLSDHPEKVIARRLSLSGHTVHNHVRAIFKAFEVHSRTELLVRFLGSFRVKEGVAYTYAG